MYSVLKVTLKKSVTIRRGAVAELPVNEVVDIQKIVRDTLGLDVEIFKLNLGFVNKSVYGAFYLRKVLAKQGLLQCVHTPFRYDWNDTPLIVVKNDSIDDFTLRKGDEIGEVWVYY